MFESLRSERVSSPMFYNSIMEAVATDRVRIRLGSIKPTITDVAETLHLARYTITGKACSAKNWSISTSNKSIYIQAMVGYVTY